MKYRKRPIVIEESQWWQNGDERQKSFEVAVEPVIKWLCDNAHPHTKIIIDCTTAELVEGVMCTVTDRYVRD